jgi:hypothetical protein
MLALIAAALLSFAGERPVAPVAPVPNLDDAIPQAACDATGCTAVWTGRRGVGWWIFSARTDRDGNVRARHTVAELSAGAIAQVATNGHRTVVAFPYTQVTLVLDEDGALVRVLNVGLAEGVASNGDTFALAGENGLQFLDFDGNPLPQPLDLGGWGVAIAPYRSGYVAITRGAARMIEHGVLSDPIAWDAGADPLSFVRVASNGDEIFVVARAFDHVRGVLVRAARVTDWPAAWTDEPQTAAAWTGSAFVAAFTTPGGTFAAQIDGAPQKRSDERGSAAWDGGRFRLFGHGISTYEPDQTKPRIATDAQNVLVVWLDGKTTLRAARFAADGTPLDGEGIVLTREADGPGAVAFDGRDWLIAYPLRGARLGWRRLGQATKHVLDAAGIGAAFVNIAAAPDGHFVIAWLAEVPWADAPDGNVAISIDGAAPQLITNGHHREVALTWRGDAFALAWVNTELRMMFHTWYEAASLTTAALPAGGSVSLGGTINGYATAPRLAGEWLVYRDNNGVEVRKDGQQWTLAGDNPAVADGLVIVAPGLAATPGGAPFYFTNGPIDAPDGVLTQHGFVAAYEKPAHDGTRVWLSSVNPGMGPRRRTARP